MALTPVSVKDASATSTPMDAYQDAAGNNIPVHSLDSTLPHYTAATTAFAMQATPTAAFVVQGSATKTVRIKRISVSGAATAAGSMPCVLTRRSTAGTLGSAVLTALTNAKHDSGSASATAVVSSVGTANYTTLGTTAGTVGAGRLCMTALGAAATSFGVQPLVFEFGSKSDQSLVLRGTSEFVTVDFSGAAIPSGGVVDIAIEWCEDAS